MSVDYDAQKDEMLALESIFDSTEFTVQEINSEFSGKFNAYVSLPEGFKLIYQMLPSYFWRNGKRQRQFEESGQSEELVIRFLPPLEFSFTLPSDYPSTSPPKFTLTSCWLGRKQLSNLCKKLDSLWEENKGLEILYLWMTFLKEESYNFIGLGSTLNISKQYTHNVNCINKYKRMQQMQRAKQSSLNTVEEASTSGVADEPKQNENTFEIPKIENGSAQHSKAYVKQLENKRPGRGRGRGRGQGKDIKKSEAVIAVPGDVAVVIQKINLSVADTANPIKGNRGSEESNLILQNTSNSVHNENPRNMPKNLKKRENRPGFLPLDQRAVTSVPTDVSLIDYLKEHNSLMTNKEFERNIFTCRICFDDKSGGQCMEFYECGHVFCRECVKGYFEVRIKEGSVQFMTCLEEGCKTEALQKQVQDIVGPELFAKYDALLLSSTLDLMEDIVYCPRKDCQYPVTRDEEDKMGLCPNCQYSFCIHCRMGYHGVEPCRIKSAAKRELVAEYEKASTDRKSQLEAKYGRRQLLQLVDITRSEDWITSNSKNCPHCQAAIEKSDGCNRMVCWRCCTNFCWICAARLDPKIPYLHFNSRASPCFNLLFHGLVEDGDDGDDDDDPENEFFDYLDDELL